MCHTFQSYACSWSYSDGSVFKQSNQSMSSYKYKYDTLMKYFLWTGASLHSHMILLWHCSGIVNLESAVYVFR